MGHWSRAALILSLAPASALAAIQSSSVAGDASKANAVKAAFRSAYNDYATYCFGHDQLNPLSRTCADPLGGWGASVIDAQSTAKIMGLDDIYAAAVAQSLRTDYTKTSSSTVSIFETTIRHVGGLLSSYELGGRANQGLVGQAVVVGDKLLHGWINGLDLPYNSLVNWNSTPAPANPRSNAIIAETGTLILEFDRLSKYSGNDTYRQYAVKAMRATINSSPLPFPGLNPQGISPRTGKPTDDYVTWGGGSDSFFEYELKYGQLTGSKETYVPAWIQAVNSSIANLMTTAGNTQRASLTYLADYSKSNGGLIPRGSHLECFHGGNWMLGGKLLQNDAIFQHGLALTEACINTYTSSATGIGPESFVYAAADGSTNGVSITNKDFYQANGFDYETPSYVLRPEVLESVFYAYRFTGDKKWQNAAWTAFNHIKEYCGGALSLAAIQDVSNVQTDKLDDSESFLFAELFKYIYLTFADGDVISLDEYVFNTEAHPFKIDSPGADFSSLNPGPRLASPSSPQKQAEAASSASPSKTSSVPLPKFSNNPLGGSIVKSILRKLLNGGNGSQQKRRLSDSSRY
ncbi:unnamed protein product [Parajaminaea phylloscopi]